MYIIGRLGDAIHERSVCYLFYFDSIGKGGHKVNLTSKLISIIKYCVFQL